LPHRRGTRDVHPAEQRQRGDPGHARAHLRPEPGRIARLAGRRHGYALNRDAEHALGDPPDSRRGANGQTRTAQLDGRGPQRHAAALGLVTPIFARSLGGRLACRVGVMGMVLTAMPSMLWVVRHTRVEEESGSREQLSSPPAGRNAPLTAALAAVFGANLALAA